MEKQDYDGAIYHKACFKCNNCNSTITPTSVAKISGVVYCKPCYIKKFRSSGGTYQSFSPQTLTALKEQGDADAAIATTGGK